MAARKKKAAKKAKRKTTRKVTKKKAAKNPRKKMGRPRIGIDWVEFDKLCELDCLLVEIAGWFNCSEATIERRVKEAKDETFAEYHRKKKGRGSIALRRAQMHAALGGNITMMIWLGKNRLGQTDRHDHRHGGGDKPIAVQVLKIGDRLIEF